MSVTELAMYSHEDMEYEIWNRWVSTGTRRQRTAMEGICTEQL